MTSTSQSPAASGTAPTYVYLSGGGTADGGAGMTELLGGKGAGLAEMTNIAIPVPPGFTITTEVCTLFYKEGRKYPAGLEEQVREGVAFVERLLDRRFGDPAKPLLFSIRSGARVSMPGMMDTVLNLGLNDAVTEGLARESGDRRFAYDSYRRFVGMYGDVVLDLKPEGKEEDPFEVILAAKKRQRGVEFDTQLGADDLKELVAEFKAEIKRRKGIDFPDDPWQQLWAAIGAVFGSWDNPRALTYRRMYGYPDDWGTAVNVQAMVFGNLGEDCATGVAFTRDPATGENRFYGEFLVNAQGEDVVAGIRTPQPVARGSDGSVAGASLEETMPAAYADLTRVYQALEGHYRDMQDLEFT
ncbi:MAG: PEP/pyruvate-binding domain-containing protein, partial [bacterium]|nr:PEP/pyruvate-binding domain-containing protein [bacterium]